MNLNFERIRISNFLSFGEDVEVSLQNQGLCLVKGENKDDAKSKSNMSGKSAFMDALVWCLFGEPYRNLRSKDIIRDNQEFCEVSLWLNEGLQLTRRISRKDPNYLAFQNTPIEQAVIEKELLGINFQQFISTIFFGDETANKKLALFAEGTGAERFGLITPMLDSETWKRGRGKAEDKSKCLQAELSTSQEELSKVELSIKSLGIRIADKKEQAQIFIARKNTLERDKEKEKVDIKHKIRELEGDMERMLDQPIADDEYADIEAFKVQLKDQKQGYEDQIKNVRLEISKLQDRHSDAKVTYAEKALLLKQKQSLYNEVQCPLCYQELKSGVKKDLKFEISAAQKDIRNYEAEMKLTEDLKKRAEIDILQIEALIEQGQSSMELVEDRLELKKSWNSDLKDVDRSITEQTIQVTRVDERYSNQERQLNEDHQKVAEELDVFLKEQGGLENAIGVCKEKIKALNFEIKHASFWIKGYGPEGAPNIDLREKLPLLNEKIRELVPALLSMDYQIEVSGQRQLKSSKKIKNEINLDMQGNFWRCSHGEKQRINTIIQIALGSLYGVRSNCLFFDEYFSGLDSTGIESATELFRNLLGIRDNLESIFVVSHSNVPDFDRELIFVKQEGITTLGV